MLQIYKQANTGLVTKLVVPSFSPKQNAFFIKTKGFFVVCFSVSVIWCVTLVKVTGLPSYSLNSCGVFNKFSDLCKILHIVLTNFNSNQHENTCYFNIPVHSCSYFDSVCVCLCDIGCFILFLRDIFQILKLLVVSECLHNSRWTPLNWIILLIFKLENKVDLERSYNLLSVTGSQA